MTDRGVFDYVSVANKYAEEVCSGKVVACRFIKKACRRHLNDLRKKKWDYYFDDWHADDVCHFAENMPHVAGSWDDPNIILEPVQVFLLSCIFGWRRKSDGGRRFSYVYIEMARKGAKSTLTAVVSLYCLCCEEEVGPEVVIGATTGQQAEKVFGPAKAMVERTPELQEAFGVKAWARKITCKETGGSMQPINSKGQTQDGWNPHLGVLDELHAHTDRGLFDVIKSAFGARKNPLFWIITTAGFNVNGVCYEQRLYVAKVLDGVIDAPHVFAAIFTLDKDDDCFDESVWIKANPMLGITPTLENMRSEAIDAKASPGAEGNFKTKRLNVWQNSIGAWLSSDSWAACTDNSIGWQSFTGLECWIGADLADKMDICAIVVAAVDESDRLIAKPIFYIPEDVLTGPEHSEGKGPAPYKSWVESGHLIATPGDWIDKNIIQERVSQLLRELDVAGIVIDEYGFGGQMAVDINTSADRDVAAVMRKSASNFTMPCKELESRVVSGPCRFLHDGNPVFAWMASNAVVERRTDDSLLPKKETANSPNKIDGIDALINAMSGIFRVRGPELSSPWDNPDFTMVSDSDSA